MRKRATGFVIKELTNDEFVVKIYRPSIGIWNTDVFCKREESLKIKDGDTVMVEIESYESEKALITRKL